MGHRNTDRGGAVGEFAWTPGSARAIRDEIVSRGGEAYLIQEYDGDSDPDFSVGKGLQAAARVGVENIVRKHGELTGILMSHYNGPSSGFHAVYPDDPNKATADVAANNPLDIRVSAAIAARVKATNTVPLLGNGLMSERNTYVGSTWYGNVRGRLGEFVATMPWRAKTVRLILEAAGYDFPRERAYLNDPAWVRNVYARAVADGLADVFGAFPHERPDVLAPASDAPVYARPDFRPRLDAFNDTPDGAIPAAVRDDDGTWFFRVGREVTITRPTPRNRWATVGGPVTGPDLVPGDRAYIGWGGTTKEGRAYGYTQPWATRIWLDHTDFGVPS
jgi:hypothetical protein